MPKTLLIFFILIGLSKAFPQSYEMKINLSNGTVVSYLIQDINKITFDGVTSADDIKNIQQIVKSFKLYQNYPNPFNPSTTIKYEIPEAGNVEVSIFDLNGGLLKTITNNNEQEGIHTINWNGTNSSGQKVASGFYIYSIKFQNKIISKKMILLK